MKTFDSEMNTRKNQLLERLLLFIPHDSFSERLLKLQRACFFATLLLISIIGGIAQEATESQRMYIYESSPAPVYDEIMRDMQENDYTVLYRYVARQIHKPMKDMIFIPIFDTEPTEMSDPSSFIVGLELIDYSIALDYEGNVLEPKAVWREDWDSFGLLEKWKFPQWRKIRKQFHHVSKVAVYSQDRTLLKTYILGRHECEPIRYLSVSNLNVCPSAEFFLTISSVFYHYIFFEDSSHFGILSQVSSPISEFCSFEELSDDTLQPLEEVEGRITKNRVAKEERRFGSY